MADSNAVLLHRWPGRRTVSVGVWIAHGASHDAEELAGITHLVEHLTLRRCGNRDRFSLAELVDRLGGDVDAWTSAEAMGLSVQTTIDALPEALSILRDAVLEPTFAQEDVELERQVALAELELMNDDPGERVGEAILRAAWGDHAYARPVIGSPDTIKGLTPEILRNHHQEKLLRPGGLLLAVVGDVSSADIEDLVSQLPLTAEVRRPPLQAPKWIGASIKLDRPATDQIHARLAFPAVPVGSSQAPIAAVLSRILGTGNSSRLFQRLREDEGLTYDIWTDLVLRSVGGLLEVGWACSPERFDDAQRLVGEELRRFAEDVSENEVEVALQGMTRALQIEAETAGGRASFDVAEVVERGRRFDLERTLAELRSVRVEKVRSMAREILRPEIMASAVCGPERSPMSLTPCIISW
ncbi:MAG: insulinase family protein [Thermoanaerobaculales bacterium]|nr:insulinase family protein [Thermoanaerobaculales bacterium]